MVLWEIVTTGYCSTLTAGGTNSLSGGLQGMEFVGMAGTDDRSMAKTGTQYSLGK
jgi:hypothetical protein